MGTVTGALAGLGVPVQLSRTGVSVQIQLPDGTDSPMQVVVVTTPPQPAPTVAAAPFNALYRLIT